MSNEAYMPEIVTLVAEDGMQLEFEVLTRFSMPQGNFAALMGLEDDNDSIVLLQVVEENGETWMEPITDDALFEAVSQEAATALDELFANGE